MTAKTQERLGLVLEMTGALMAVTSSFVRLDFWVAMGVCGAVLFAAGAVLQIKAVLRRK